MKKRIFTSVATIVVALVCAITISAQNYRERICFDHGWKFAFGNASSPEKDFGCGTEYFNYLTKAASIHNIGPYSPKFDATQWKEIDLPHDWVCELPYEAQASHSHGYKTVGYKYPETSIGWYRKTFTIPETDKGKHLWLQFDGIFRDAKVWVNGFYLGNEPSGYAVQTYDISEYLNYGSENIVAVRVDATLEEGWFYEGAGIYRHVWLNKAASVHVAPFGTFVHSTFKGNNFSHAEVTIETNVRNMGLSSADFSLRHKIIDAAGNVVAECENENRNIMAKDEKSSVAIISLDNPILWSCENPYLYNIVTEVICNGKISDIYTTSTGIRKVEFDPDKGFILNGKALKLKGFNIHQDHAGVGSAIPDDLQEWRLLQLKRLGCNAYRSSHNPMTPETLQACDKLGILVIEENRLTGVNDEHIRLLEKMIRRDRNHPSIILWSVGNEEWGIEWNEWGSRIAASMREYCHRADPTRLMTIASSSGPKPLEPVDVAGYNYILQNPVEQHRKDYPDRCAIGSEETTGCGTRGIYYDDFENGRMASLNRKKHGPDSIYNCIERGWKFYDERPWLGGLFYWTGFDYRGEPNPLKFPATGSEFGILDYCGFPKDEAFYLKSWWTDEPTLHILPHWNLKGHEGEKVSIWVYSNCKEVDLTVNGKKLGRKQMPENGHLEWETTYMPGNILATGYIGGKKVLRKKIETTSEAVKTSISIDYKNSEGVWKSFECEGTEQIRIPEPPQDICSGSSAVINLTLLDAKDRFVPDACNELKVILPEEWKLLGYGNGDPAFREKDRPYETKGEDSTTVFSIKAFNGHAQIIIMKR